MTLTQTPHSGAPGADPRWVLRRAGPNVSAGVGVSAGAGAGAALVPDVGQAAVLDHSSGALLVLGSPGTGKTTVLLEYLARTLEQGQDPARAVLLSSNRASVDQLRQQLALRLGRASAEPLIRTPAGLAYGLLRTVASAEGSATPRLIPGAEMDRVLRDLIAAHGPSIWPSDLAAAVGTRALATELRHLLLRCFERGVDAPGLAELGRRFSRPDWVTASRFIDEYDARFSLAGDAAYSAAEMVRAAAVVSRQRQVDSALAVALPTPDLVLVDEAQELDPAALHLLTALVPVGARFITAADPDQTAYAFRGADRDPVALLSAGLRGWPGPARVIRLVDSHRLSAAPAALVSALAKPLPSVVADGLGPGRSRPLRMADSTGNGLGRVEVFLASDPGQEAAMVATAVRRAQLLDGVPLADMAVIVRSTRHSLPVLRRAFTAAGIAVALPASDTPLSQQPLVNHLLLLLQVALDPAQLDEDAAIALLMGPVGRLDPVRLRRLRRELRGNDRAVGLDRSSAAALVELLSTLPDPARATGPDWGAVHRVQRWISAARHALADPIVGPAVNPAEVLWQVWEASGLQESLLRRATSGGAFGDAADRDLDAAVALLDRASEDADRFPGIGIGVFLDGLSEQHVPDDDQRGARGRQAVTVSTPHRAKGRQWRRVWVVGLQDGSWPDLRPRGSLLGSEVLVDVFADHVSATGTELGVEHQDSQRQQLLRDERRLLVIACSRASEQVTVSACLDLVHGLRPSRFLSDITLGIDEELPVPPELLPGVAAPTLAGMRRRIPVLKLLPQLQVLVEHTDAQPGTAARAAELRGTCIELAAPLDLQHLVVDLRRRLQGLAADAVSVLPTVGPDDRRSAAALLALLWRHGVTGADPSSWAGLSPTTSGLVIPADATLRVTPSTVEGAARCGLAWLLRDSGAGSGASTSQTFGQVIHLVASQAAEHSLRTDAAPAGVAELERLLAEHWGAVKPEALYVASRFRLRASEQLKMLADYLANPAGHPVAVEHQFLIPVPAELIPEAAQGHEVLLSGRVDRLESDGSQGAIVIDVKTGKSPTSAQKVHTHPQLAVYQWAANHGAFAEFGLTHSNGAALLELGAKRDSLRLQPALPDPVLPDPVLPDPVLPDPVLPDPAAMIRTALQVMTADTVSATRNDMCRSCEFKVCCPLQPDGQLLGGAR